MYAETPTTKMANDTLNHTRVFSEQKKEDEIFYSTLFLIFFFSNLMFWQV